MNKISLLLFFVFLLFGTSAFAVSDRQFKDAVLHCLVDKKCNFLNIDRFGTPEQFSYKVASALIADVDGRSSDVIVLLSDALTQINYDPNWESGQDGIKAFVGVPLGISFWRELSYLLLGRSYYRQKNFVMAEKQLRGVPERSLFFNMALVELFWSCVALKKYDQLPPLYQLVLKHQATMPQFHDYKVIKGFMLNRSGESEQGIKLLSSVAYDQTINEETRELAFNLFADLGFEYWHKNFASMSEDQRIEKLKSIVAASEQISAKNCREECQFFSAESWWNLATLYRIKDPVALKQDISQSLKRAQQALQQSMEKAASTFKTSLREDAYFLGVVISWERNDFKRAIKWTRAYDKIFPVGRYREDVYQLIADHYFENKLYKDALPFYQSLVEIGSLEKGTYGMFKAAWSFYNLDQKWSALRHLERIVVASKKQVSSEQYHLGVLNESKRDMLLFLAELTTFPEALEELMFLKSSDEDQIDLLEKLAATYKALGRFDQSILTFSHLLDHADKKTVKERYFDWLSEVLDNQLRVRNFVALRNNYTSYIELFRKRHNLTSLADLNNLDVFWKFIDSLTITLHREAKRVLDHELWNTVDYLYNDIERYDFDHSSFSFLYFGAQRFEEKNETIRSIKWYRKAASIPSDNALDAALSGLRLCKNLIDDYSETNLLGEPAAEAVVSYVEWLLETFPKIEQISLAYYLHFEARFSQKEYLKIMSEFSQLIEKNSLGDASYRQFSTIVNHFYKLERWTDVYDVASMMSKRCDLCKDQGDIVRVMQEAAFQAAFTGKVDFETAKLWYLRSISHFSNSMITLKAWHNLLLLTIDTGELKSIQDSYAQFETTVSTMQFREELEKKLVFDTRIAVAQFYARRYLLLDSTRIELVAHQAFDQVSSESLFVAWGNYLAFYGAEAADSYRQIDPKIRDAWFRSNPDELNRFDLYYAYLLPKLESVTFSKKIRALDIFNFYDYFYLQSPTRAQGVSAWCKLFSKDCDLLLKSSFSSTFSYLLYPASSTPWSSNAFDDQFETLKDLKKSSIENFQNSLVSFIQIIDQSDQAYLKQLEAKLKARYFHLRAEAACDLFDQKKLLLKWWDTIRNEVENSIPDWTELLELLKERKSKTSDKVAELQQTCDKATEELSLFSPISKKSDLLWGNSSPHQLMAHSRPENRLFEEAFSKYPMLIDRVYFLLSKNYPMIAERLILSSIPSDEVIISMALWRLYFDDQVSAAGLLKEIKQESPWANDVQVLRAVIRAQNSYAKLFYLPPPKSSEIKSNFLRELFKEIDD